MSISRRSQAALEFLMAHGWALLVVIIAFIALAYFGVLSPSSYLPEKCTLELGLHCSDHRIDAANGVVLLQLENGMGKGIVITEVNATGQALGEAGCSVDGATSVDPPYSNPLNNLIKGERGMHLSPGETASVPVICEGIDPDRKGKSSYDIILSWHYDDSSYPHTMQGELLSAIEEGVKAAVSSGSISMSPSALEYGDVDPGSSSTLQFTIENTGLEPLSVKSILVSDDVFELSHPGLPFTLNSGNVQAVDVTFRPSDPNPAFGQIDVFSSDFDHYPSSVFTTGNTYSHYTFDCSVAWNGPPWSLAGIRWNGDTDARWLGPVAGCAYIGNDFYFLYDAIYLEEGGSVTISGIADDESKVWVWKNRDELDEAVVWDWTDWKQGGASANPVHATIYLPAGIHTIILGVDDTNGIATAGLLSIKLDETGEFILHTDTESGWCHYRTDNADEGERFGNECAEIFSI
ncbi:MAG: hypothetical protein ABH879_03170 [archaeon]